MFRQQILGQLLPEENVLNVFWPKTLKVEVIAIRLIMFEVFSMGNHNSRKKGETTIDLTDYGLNNVPNFEIR